jgi:1-acyl-sn-glycerol-3-phosphate acyltransferase
MVLLLKNAPPPPAPELGLVRRVCEALDGPLKAYFRYRVEGLENIPEGRAMLVGIHNGGILPVDSVILGMAYHKHFAYRRPLHFLAHSILWNLPRAVTQPLEQLGVVKTNPRAAQQLLEAERTVCVYPGGAYEVYRPFWQRHEVDWNGHMGYLRLAVRTRTPIVLVPGVGAHETLIVLARGQRLLRMVGLEGKWSGISILPVALTLPGGLSVGPFPPHFPLPAQISLRALEPLEIHNLPEGRALFRRVPNGDPELLGRLHHLVQQKMQEGMNALSVGRVPFLGQFL